jgi:hypothetical protein
MGRHAVETKSSGAEVILVAKAPQLSGFNRETRLPGQNSFGPMMSSRRAGRASRIGSAKRREKKDSWRMYATLVRSALRTHRTHMTLNRGAEGRARALPPPPLQGGLLFLGLLFGSPPERQKNKHRKSFVKIIFREKRAHVRERAPGGACHCARP